jgi:hypothetical protein
MQIAAQRVFLTQGHRLALVWRLLSFEITLRAVHLLDDGGMCTRGKLCSRWSKRTPRRRAFGAPLNRLGGSCSILKTYCLWHYQRQLPY